MRAQLTHLAVLALSSGAVMLGDDQDLGAHSRPFFFSAVDQFRRILDADALLALRRGLEAHQLQLLARLDAERGQGERLERLLLGLHDVRQLHVARLVQAQVGGDDRRQIDLEGLESRVHLARDARARLRSSSSLEA